jgi:biopolymer transport protein ExbD
MPLKTQTDELPAMNLTPMIDVVFLLIIFFMAASKFAEVEADLELKLPEVAAAAPLTSAPKQRTVSVERDGAVELDGLSVSLAELTARLVAAQSEYPQLSVVIRGDAACPFQHVAAALAACKDAHISELGITVKLAQDTSHGNRK